MMEEMKGIKGQVYQLLKKYPETRNSDKKLIIRYIVEYNIGYHSKNGLFIPYSHFDDLPNFETIRRTRQKIQEPEPKGMGLFQAKNTVQDNRNINELEMRSINRWWDPITDTIQDTLD